MNEKLLPVIKWFNYDVYYMDISFPGEVRDGKIVDYTVIIDPSLLDCSD